MIKDKNDKIDSKDNKINELSINTDETPQIRCLGCFSYECSCAEGHKKRLEVL